MGFDMAQFRPLEAFSPPNSTHKTTAEVSTYLRRPKSRSRET